ncbi:hypothetical protein QE401_000129, partial [Pseudoroseomonas cervicalis]|nr:hypothetical protein [Pseudoroseomonas cervicalis]
MGRSGREGVSPARPGSAQSALAPEDFTSACHIGRSRAARSAA